MDILILDDDLCRHEFFNMALIGHIVKSTTTAAETIEELKSNNFDVVFLDHDLGGQQMVESGDNTGYEVAKWLSEHPNRIPNQVIIHSFNPAGAKNMKAVLPQAAICPGAWTKIGQVI
jgi:CheY-like chemotaxis protein